MASKKIGDGDVLAWRMGGGMREYRKRVQRGEDSVNFCF